MGVSIEVLFLIAICIYTYILIIQAIKMPIGSSDDEARRKSDGHKVSEDPKTTFPRAEMQKALANMEIKRIEVHRALRKKGRIC
jgi:uncharacterized small protein (DUF1192 family)